MASEAPRSRVGKPTGMVAFRNGMYNMFMRRNSTYMTMVILAGWAGSTLWTRTARSVKKQSRACDTLRLSQAAAGTRVFCVVWQNAQHARPRSEISLLSDFAS
ncbi:hypothetical protein FVE85_7660 [Porphyridium purpureum]|uniref:Uncharacterized protein n=1 Tax=Porphyridium purpureum TaxID=35688 RepID=A0A5J4Z9S1_PORPP|nr:hypothetical protein FVE85_7660 [Porphyridium purpureum]|eukprot:POR8367..scf295_1